MSGPLRLAVVNWRDPWHPAAGGAERYAWEIARRTAEQGARVHFVTSRAPGQRREERVDGVDVVRLGGRFTVYPLVLLWLLRRRLGRGGGFDAVIDCQNGIPFFTPWALPRRVPVFCVVHHVHDAQFGVHFPAWMAWIGRMLEGPVSRRAYRRHAFVVVSPSTLRAVRGRLGWTGPVYVVPNGSGAPPPVHGAVPTGRPQLVCVTRLVPHKRLDLLLDLARVLADRHPGLRLHIVGTGPEEAALAKGITERGLDGVAVAHGYVTERVKAALVAASDLHLSTSQGEGWGLSVIEAAALGVPTVAYDVDGLRDAVRDGVTGWLVGPGEDPSEVVERALKDLDEPGRRAETAARCRAWAGEFDWARTAARMADLVEAAVRAGSSSTADDRAQVVHRYGDVHLRVVEGPVRDELLAGSGDVRAIREATTVERLLGRPRSTGEAARGDLD
ncbi:glycosyltransferase family 4 protein [Actinomadura opuntiae]|uniref:glycosyltransferase family 4 protein n=1 Tax=Actinomadura sp. OS1-43 TaxID=604315 RepID=UPI00255ABE2B|nr:glycosyltransferase family 4 protein [Actinomadura sp. OS1-43]MDL4814567.1 glycosyltransferase family 4 protein [Actinomadura sp. OS1-43]